MVTELWGSPTANIVMWINEIQDDIASKLPIDYFKFYMKKQLPTAQSYVNLSLDKPAAPTTEIIPGGSLTNGSTYKSYVTFIMWDADQRRYIESEPSVAGTARAADGTNKTLRLSAVPILPLDTLSTQTSQTFSEDFINDTGFTYDSNATEFSGGALQQISQVYTDEQFFAGYKVNDDGDRGTGSLTGTPTGSSSVANGLLNLTGGTVKYITYDGDNAPLTNAGTIRVGVIPNYSGYPAGNRALFSIAEASGVANRISLYQNSSGAIVLEMSDSAGSGITTSSTSPTSMVAGQLYDVELNFDLAGTTRLFVNGVAVITVATSATRTQAAFFRIGTDWNRTYASDFYVDYVQVFNTVQHTATYTPTLEPHKYLADEVSLPVITYNGAGSVQAFTSFTTTQNDDEKFTLNGLYWNGSAWATSDGTYAQASSPADINTNIGTLPVSDTLAIIAYFDANSLTQGILSDLSVGYTGQVYSSADHTIWRRVYVATLASGGSAYGEPFYVGDIEDNITTDYSITSEPTSTVSPPSSTEVDEITSDHLTFASGNGYLTRKDSNLLKRQDPSPGTSVTPRSFDYEGLDEIYLYPQLSTSATDAQKTLQYTVFRRPHESFYDVDRIIDLPIQAKKALVAGVLWRGWEFKDRDGWVSKQNLYEKYRDELIDKLKRQRGAPSVVRDVSGDTMGYEV